MVNVVSTESQNLTMPLYLLYRVVHKLQTEVLSLRLFSSLSDKQYDLVADSVNNQVFC